MKRTVFFVWVVVFLLFVAGSLSAQESAYDVEGWKKRVASPTYGVAIGFLELQNSEGEIETIAVPGFELRIFNGVNVAKRGGFFTGYEVGTIFFIAESDPVTLTGGGEVYIEGMAGSVFLLSKYGYRIDLGIEAAGFSVGAEMGIGVQMSIGSIDVYDVNSDWEDDAPSQMPFSLMLDTALEGAFRFGQNFRIFARAGAGLIPPIFDESFSDATGTGQYFSFSMLPVVMSARLGFALNY